eukprot:1098498-Pleurochrysis_carterae.AAC.1
MAAAVGLDAADFGGKWWRIGGATDMRDLKGEEGCALIKQRGRWQSDVASVYQRAIIDAQLEAISAGIGDASGVELKAVCAGCAQPSNFRAGGARDGGTWNRARGAPEQS